jgi:hypothetical protein
MRASATALILLGFVLGLSACGGGDSSAEPGTEAATVLRGPQPPKGASRLERQIYRTFQPPLPDPEVSGSAKAIESGEAACQGKTPSKVKRQFIAESDLSADQRQALEQIDRAEGRPSGDFAAGQLAALVYEGTLEGELAEYGYQGCVYALARGLERRLGGR